MPIRVRDPDNGVSLDMTPIIDIVFLLLTFFLVATTFQRAEREMNIALPFAASSGPMSAALRELVINVTADGRMIVSGRETSAQDLQGIVARAVEANPNQKVTVRGDRDTAYANIVRALDICKGAGIQQPYLDTVMD
jgi:biopolymer transport protein ExbD